jgi:uncharacterized membrane protein
MTKGRLEAFSDGVIAILITIMVLELKVPHGADWAALRPLAPALFTYLLSFAFLGIYWNNHHHMLQAADRVNGAILWANLHLLFWLSLFPFVTGWMAENHLAAVPTAAYGIVLLCAAIAYTVLQATIVRLHGPDSKLAAAVEGGLKEKISLGSYFAAIPVAFFAPLVSVALYVLVAVIWLVPDRRIERQLGGVTD